jgi:hypothetical protein
MVTMLPAAAALGTRLCPPAFIARCGPIMCAELCALSLSCRSFSFAPRFLQVRHCSALCDIEGRLTLKALNDQALHILVS